ncbi:MULTISPECIES: hypothetical protein [unclassified Mesorhizobium]|uniref:hypothetical protein n=1 Tax=unclassified Mesorhizobium TaxID=325217 RepID=UPI001CCAC61A|nr:MULTISPECIES: hypothetical protein [unclassified Mesorhizobium]MBZ9683056.1 hypothetical protein [Mesorhizobium sp. CO1-1-2]MBZ9924414.1 hypothetical protein [Mesorhizobium sp. BR1-1-4]
MTGSFFSAAACFWQPASSARAVQARIEAAGKDKRLGVLADGGETDDVTFLLMAPLGRAPVADRGPSRIVRRIVDPEKKETGLVDVSPDWLSQAQSTLRWCRLEENLK